MQENFLFPCLCLPCIDKPIWVYYHKNEGRDRNGTEYSEKCSFEIHKKAASTIAFIAKAGAPALAEPILPMNVSTVYRTLNTLTEKKILIRSVRQDGKAYYSLAKKDHSHRLVCDLCGKVIPVDTCPLSELEETLQQKTGFRITGHSLEFTGLCPECSKKDTDEK